MNYRAKQDDRLPRGYSNGLLGLHDRKPFSYNNQEISEIASQIKDPSFRIMVSENGVHVFNRDGLLQAVDPFAFYANLKVEEDASHAFYLGVELARAQIAWQLKKRYVQDEALNWGVASDDRGQRTEDRKSPDRKSHREASLKEKQAKKK